MLKTYVFYRKDYFLSPTQSPQDTIIGKILVLCLFFYGRCRWCNSCGFILIIAIGAWKLERPDADKSAPFRQRCWHANVYQHVIWRVPISLWRQENIEKYLVQHNSSIKRRKGRRRCHLAWTGQAGLTAKTGQVGYPICPARRCAMPCENRPLPVCLPISNRASFEISFDIFLMWEAWRMYFGLVSY